MKELEDDWEVKWFCYDGDTIDVVLQSPALDRLIERQLAMMASAYGALFRACCCHSDANDAGGGSSAHNADASTPTVQIIDSNNQQRPSHPSK